MLLATRHSRLSSSPAACQIPRVIVMTPGAINTDAVADRPYLVGVEVGPLVIRAGVFTADFHPVGKTKVSTKKERGPADVIQRIARCVEYAVDECDLALEEVRALGVGVPGQTDAAMGVAMDAESLGWRDIPLRGALEKLLRVPVFVENHFRLSALGTYAREIHASPRRFAALFLGPEIGGALMEDGELSEAPPNSVSRRRSDMDPGSDGVFAVMPHEEFRHARIRDLRKAVRKGSPAVVEFARAVARRAGEVSAGLVRTFQPDIILLGGGLMDEMREEILGIVEEAIRRGEDNNLTPARVELVASILGDLAGMTGGAVLAAQKSAAILR